MDERNNKEVKMLIRILVNDRENQAYCSEGTNGQTKLVVITWEETMKLAQ